MYYLPHMKAPLVFLPCINVFEYYISNTNSTWSINTAICFPRLQTSP